MLGIDPTKRLEELSSVPVDFTEYIGSSYRELASESTQDFFKTLHHGQFILGMQMLFSSRERLSVLSPYLASPYSREIWHPFTTDDSGEYDFEEFRPPVGILGVTESITSDSFISHTYNDGIISGLSPESKYFAVEVYRENDLMWRKLASPAGFTRADIPEGYTVHHVPAMLALIEWAAQQGLRSVVAMRLASGLGGHPFSSLGGEITEVTSSYVRIESELGEEVAQIPDGYSNPIKSTGVTVEAFEPLTTATTASVDIEGQSDREWGKPILCESNADGSIELVGSGTFLPITPVRIHLLTQDESFDFLVRYQENSRVVLNQALEFDGIGYVQPLTVIPSAIRNVTVDVPGGKKSFVERYFREAFSYITKLTVTT